MPIETARLDLRRKPKLSNEIKTLSDTQIEARAKADKNAQPMTEHELARMGPGTPRPIRAELGLTQEEFASLFNIPTATVRDWEQGRVRPDAAARALLKLIAAAPRWAAGVFSGDPQAFELRKSFEAGRQFLDANRQLIEVLHEYQQALEQSIKPMLKAAKQMSMETDTSGQDLQIGRTELYRWYRETKVPTTAAKGPKKAKKVLRKTTAKKASPKKARAIRG